MNPNGEPMDSMLWRHPELFTPKMPKRLMSAKGTKMSRRQKEALMADRGKLRNLRRVADRQERARRATALAAAEKP